MKEKQSRITLELTTRDGKTVMSASFSSEVKTKAEALRSAYRGSLESGLPNNMDDFYQKVMASELPDGDDLHPRIDVCGCGKHAAIITFAGSTDAILSKEVLKSTLANLIADGLISADDAMALEVEMNEKVSLKEMSEPGDETGSRWAGYIFQIMNSIKDNPDSDNPKGDVDDEDLREDLEERKRDGM